MDHPEFLSLPDCQLLAVLSYLSPDELLQCRAVCRRLRDVCLHPQLWCSVRLLYFSDSTKTRTLPILRLAPCLREFNVEFLDQEAVATMCRSSCVVQKLSLHIWEQTCVARAFVVLQRMCTVGGLQELCIRTGSSTSELDSLLYVILYSLKNLTELTLDCYSLTTSSYSLEGITPSLTSLHFVCSRSNPANILQTLLTGHAPTLRTLHLSVDQNLHLSLSIPNLESLTCPPMAALSQLQSASCLKEVNLPRPTGDLYPRGALEFLRGAPQLRHVSVYMPKKNSAAPLLALSKSPSAGRVESLSLQYCGNMTECLIKQVADSLHHFPSLLSLTVQAATSTTLLRAVTTSTPRLTTLKVYGPSGVCLHNWLHGPVGELLARSPRLHLHLQVTSLTFRDNKCTCVWCEWGCHTELKKGTEFAFSSHRREVGCPPDCFQIPKCASCDL